MSPEVTIPKPTPTLISEYEIKYKKEPQYQNYRDQEAALNLLFNSYPENKKIEHVLLKVSALKDFYSTVIYDTYSVAKHILTKDVDARLEASDYSLVTDIAQTNLENKRSKKEETKYFRFYSFASKYCSHHKPDIYPIYDSFVEKMLMHYLEADGFDKFKKTDLRNYKRFIEVIMSFKSHYKLEKSQLKEVDHFLWMAGKEFFPKTKAAVTVEA